MFVICVAQVVTKVVDPECADLHPKLLAEVTLAMKALWKLYLKDSMCWIFRSLILVAVF